MPAAAESKPLLDVLTLERPEQLKALGHPLRLSVLELLGTADGDSLTNRELAQKLDVDPGHLHFHGRMLLRVGLDELAPLPRACAASRGPERAGRGRPRTREAVPLGGAHVAGCA